MLGYKLLRIVLHHLCDNQHDEDITADIALSYTSSLSSVSTLVYTNERTIATRLHPLCERMLSLLHLSINLLQLGLSHNFKHNEFVTFTLTRVIDITYLY